MPGWHLSSSHCQAGDKSARLTPDFLLAEWSLVVSWLKYRSISFRMLITKYPYGCFNIQVVFHIRLSRYPFSFRFVMHIYNILHVSPCTTLADNLQCMHPPTALRYSSCLRHLVRCTCCQHFPTSLMEQWRSQRGAEGRRPPQGLIRNFLCLLFLHRAG